MVERRRELVGVVVDAEAEAEGVVFVRARRADPRNRQRWQIIVDSLVANLGPRLGWSL